MAAHSSATARNARVRPASGQSTCRDKTPATDSTACPLDVLWDVCGTGAKVPMHLYTTPGVDAFTADWRGKYIWLAPAAGDDIRPWVAKAAACEAEICVCVLPFLSDAGWFREHILRNPRAEIRVPMGQGRAAQSHMIVIFRRSRS